MFALGSKPAKNPAKTTPRHDSEGNLVFSTLLENVAIATAILKRNHSPEVIAQATILCEKAMKQHAIAMSSGGKLVSKSALCRLAAGITSGEPSSSRKSHGHDRRSPPRGPYYNDRAKYPRDDELVTGSSRQRRQNVRAWSNVIPVSSAHDQGWDGRHSALIVPPPHANRHHDPDAPSHRGIHHFDPVMTPATQCVPIRWDSKCRVM